MGERMVGLINAVPTAYKLLMPSFEAFAERERVRQLLLADADIVVTEEKKALLEERRRSSIPFDFKGILVQDRPRDGEQGANHEAARGLCESTFMQCVRKR